VEINASLAEHNANRKPFVWTKSAEAILAKLDRCPLTSVWLSARAMVIRIQETFYA
jgi:hypothetical protein